MIRARARACIEWTLVAALLAIAPRSVVAEEERIVDYRSRIEVRADGSLSVTETIAVVANDDEIKRGIYRDFPTEYDGPYWTRVEVPFRVTGVERDGREEPYHLAGQENGVRVYAGREDLLLPPGPYEYRISYETAEQLGFFADHDELYWNVTGNGWTFPIERASAAVILPAGIPQGRMHLEGYTGYAGSRERALRSWIDEAGVPRFETTRPLAEWEGLTIVVSFPKGFVHEPTREERWAEMARDNMTIVLGVAGVVLVLLYYAVAWMLVGRDPERGTIIPLYDPPLGLAPACMRYVREMEYDQRCFTAALVNMAVKGGMRIEEDGGEYSLVKASSVRDAKLSLGERQIASHLLSSGRLKLESKNHQKVKSAIRSLRDALVLEYDGKLFFTNRRWFIAGMALSALCLVIAGLSGPLDRAFGFVFLTLWLSGWTFGTFHVGVQALRAWQGVFLPGRGAFARIGALISGLISLVFAVPMLAGWGFGLWALTTMTSVWMVPILTVLIGASFLFFELLKRPTQAGRKLMDQIDGFRMYLATAEGDEIARIAGPEKTPALFERLLPYAIALGVENQWAEKFSAVLAAAGRDQGDGSYRPLWYSGGSWQRLGAASFVGSLGPALSGAVSSSSTAPGSRSGGGGGGSSGGGGGGGGGGGW